MLSIITQMWKCVNKMCKASARSDETDYTNLFKINKHNYFTTPIDIEVLIFFLVL